MIQDTMVDMEILDKGTVGGMRLGRMVLEGCRIRLATTDIEERG